MMQHGYRAAQSRLRLASDFKALRDHTIFLLPLCLSVVAVMGIGLPLEYPNAYNYLLYRHTRLGQYHD